MPSDFDTTEPNLGLVEPVRKVGIRSHTLWIEMPPTFATTVHKLDYMRSHNGSPIPSTVNTVD